MGIAVDAVSNGSVFATSLTVSHTVAGSNRALVVGVIAGASDIVTGVTYDGVAMTRVDVRNNGNSTAYMYYLLAPNTGTHDYVISVSGGAVTINAEGLSLTGVKQSGQPDASATSVASATTSLATSVTTIADNCIVVATYAVDSAGVTSITNATSVNAFMGYSAIKTPAGGVTLTANSGSNNAWASVGASFSPSITQTGTSFLLNFV